MMMMCVGTNAQDVSNVRYSKKLTARAEGGDDEAMFNLGLCYEQGKVITQDYSKAVYWWKKGAENGDDGSIYNLGSCYLFYVVCRFCHTFFLYTFVSRFTKPSF